jgi:hypothetical protein
MANTFNKTAIDANAETYWIEYFKDTGYGELWVRDIPKRVKAALGNKAGQKTAAAITASYVSPLATVITTDSVHLEGMVVSASYNRAFSAEFSHEGELLDFVAVPL